MELKNKIILSTGDIHISKEDKESIWVATIDNPPANCLTEKLLNSLSMLLEKFDFDRNSKALILTGAGQRFFIGGADINQILDIRSPEDGARLAEIGQALCDKLENSSKPIIAAINGLCIGGGNEISMACHIRIASDKASFQQPEVNLGIIPAFGGTQRLVRLIGPYRARKMILMCEKMEAEYALHIGLVDEIVGHSGVLNRALAIARTLTSKSQVAIQAAQKAIQSYEHHSFQDGLKIELECFKRVCEKGEMKEALSAFKERRKPVFKNESFRT